jgi:hypothetical protein
MANINRMSGITQRNWWIDAVLFSSALAAALSGIYFLYFPSGGFQGGRNPYYNIQIIFSRHTWSDVHMWAGILMVAIAAAHIILHWSWVVNMTRRMWKDITGKNGKMNWRGRWNLILNIAVGLSFIFTAISGIYFLYVPSGRSSVDPAFLVSRTTWDLIHTWAGAILVVSMVIHYAIHWRWIVNVTENILHSNLAQERRNQSKPVLQESA